MEIKTILINDLKNAKKNNEKMLKFALEELLIKIGELSDNNSVINRIEQFIEEKGRKVLKYIQKNKIKNQEIDIYSINVYNTYLCRYVFKKNRKILYEYMFDIFTGTISWNKDFEVEPKVISINKKRFFGLF